MKSPGSRAGWAFLLVCWLAPAGAFAQEQHASGEAKEQQESQSLIGWNWANFVVLAGFIVYLAAKNGPAFFAARSRQIRKDIIEAGDARKEADERAAAVDRKLANLAADIAGLREESERERQAETERLQARREAERIKIQAHAEREIESAGKAARMDLKRYAAGLAVELAERKIRARMNPAAQDGLVRGFVRDLGSPDSPTAAGAD